ncbi:hypothetical protein D3C75_1050060 [compost metagenome]
MDRSSTTVRVVSPAWRRATPKPMAHVSTPMKLALSRALTGLSTAFSNRFCSTSAMPPGALSVASLVLSARCEGNSMLATTATTAAAKVPSRYSQRIGRMWVSWP